MFPLSIRRWGGGQGVGPPPPSPRIILAFALLRCGGEETYRNVVLLRQPARLERKSGFLKQNYLARSSPSPSIANCSPEQDHPAWGSPSLTAVESRTVRCQGTGGEASPITWERENVYEKVQTRAGAHFGARRRRHPALCAHKCAGNTKDRRTYLCCWE